MVGFLKAGWQSWITITSVAAATGFHLLFIPDLFPLPASSVSGGVIAAVVISLITHKNQKRDVLRRLETTISNRISDFEPLTYPDSGRSIFWNDAFSKQNIKPRKEWDWYREEKYSGISAELTRLKADLQLAQRQGSVDLFTNVFVRFCSSVRSLGAFIGQFGQYFNHGEGEVPMDFEINAWFNDTVVVEYNNFVDRLHEDARALQSEMGNSIDTHAESVMEIKPLTV